MKVIKFDANRCNGCYNCQIACKDEHCGNDWMPYAKAQPDTGSFWCRVEERERGSVPKVRVSYIVHMCQHCEDCVLMAKAPEAVYRREDGLVIIDPAKAEGMKDLVDACPYGAVYWNAELNLPQKCTGCAHLLDEGWEAPRCVEVCGPGALTYVDQEELASEGCEQILPDADTKPRMVYANLPKRFVGGIAVDLQADEVVIGAKVQLQNKKTGELLETETDEFGGFWFHQIEPNEYSVFVSKEGYTTRVIETSTVDKDQNVGVIEMFAV
ncbi:4Fe-4S dicluster domain-containing protein [Adlercreutzia sp. ZJ473]|uniref:4Fe-4S dicluster domain-containing protein n=1 Tax=Adlercreutzia sp. ZJ473 TaxID=2722822 RepID=UPI001557A5F9|nr:4Fe-4S dicluster domain-containing protein [Adlercreutzia sp. ZJ473]